MWTLRGDFRATRSSRTRPRDRFGALLALGSVLLVQGCAVGPDYAAPEPPLPDRWRREATEGQVDLRTWWTLLDDPVLDGLMARANQGSLTLQTALARIDQARAQLGVASGQYWPTADAVGFYSRHRASENGPMAALGAGGDYSSLHSAGLDATWEIDAFGRIKRSVEASRASLEASIEDYRDIQVTLYAEIASNYVLVRALQERLSYAEQNIALQRQTLQLTRDRRQAELAPELDVRQAELNLASTESVVPTLQTQLTEATHRIAVLLGAQPGTLQETLSEPGPVPSGPEQALANLPTELLRQRPDIRGAERQLAAQTARVGVATSALYPAFSLSGTFALEATEASDLTSRSSRTFTLLPAVRWNLFDGNRIRSTIQVEEARTHQALLQYEQTVLLALADVEDAMVAYAQEKTRLAALERSVTAARRSVELVNSLYKSGLTDFQNVLDMQRVRTQQEDALAQSKGLVTQYLIGVYKALGGGWPSS